jgi:hypothetical protein
MDDDQAYRAMDLLVEADTLGKVQEAVFFAVANLLNLEVDVLFFDTTWTYFERDDEDHDEPGEGDDGAGWAFAATASPRTTAMTCPRS